MNLPVVTHPEAEGDLERAVDWYESQRAGLGGRFLDEARAARQRVAAMPEGYRLLRRGVRRAPLHGFPYSLIYVVGGTQIDIIAVVHSSRRPGSWRDRLRT